MRSRTTGCSSNGRRQDRSIDPRVYLEAYLTETDRALELRGDIAGCLAGGRR